jgi:hypothetical protein
MRGTASLALVALLHHHRRRHCGALLLLRVTDHPRPIVIQLTDIALPSFGVESYLPDLPFAEYRQRLNDIVRRMIKRSVDVLIVYANREHAANLEFLAGLAAAAAVVARRRQGIFAVVLQAIWRPACWPFQSSSKRPSRLPAPAT